jgi:hypothetical protein
MPGNSPIFGRPAVSAYAVPADDRPRFLLWDAGTDADQAPTEIRWWLPAKVHYGGQEMPVVVDSKGEMSVFPHSGGGKIATTAAPYVPHQPLGEDFWPMCAYPQEAAHPGDPAEVSHLLRDTGWMACRVDNELGLATFVKADGEDWVTLWRLAYAFTLMGFYPPLGIGFEGVPDEFRRGVDTLGERGARKVKRALIDRLTHDRRSMRDLSTRIETHWQAS